MTTDTIANDLLVEGLAGHLRSMDLVSWQRIATWAEQSALSFEDLRLLIALARMAGDGPATVSELGDLAGLPLDVAYPATHKLRDRGYLDEEQRHYVLNESGHELVASYEAAHREGIQAYVDTLDHAERARLLSVFGAGR